MKNVERLIDYSSDIIVEATKNASIIGVGTGRTVKLLLERLPSKFFEKAYFVASSLDTAIKLKERGARLLDITMTEHIDFYFDSADWFDHRCNLIKGGGGALLREKILMSLAVENLILVSAEKYANNLTEKPIPIEISPPALSYVKVVVEKSGLKLVFRNGGRQKWGPLLSDNGNLLADVYVVSNDFKHLEKLDYTLSAITGVVATGIFVEQMVKQLIISDYNRTIKDSIRCDGKNVQII